MVADESSLRYSISFDHLFLEAIDDVLRQVLGESSVKMIYIHMERVSCLRLEEVAEKPEVFVELGRLLGSVALLIEMLILKKLYSKLELKFVEKEG